VHRAKSQGRERERENKRGVGKLKKFRRIGIKCREVEMFPLECNPRRELPFI
jgi:hypothetical protein